MPIRRRSPLSHSSQAESFTSIPASRSPSSRVTARRRSSGEPERTNVSNSRNVSHHGIWRQLNCLIICDESLGPYRFSEARQRLPEVLPRLILEMRTPQQCCQLFARHGFCGQRQIGEEGTELGAGKGDPACGASEFELSQQLEVKHDLP